MHKGDKAINNMQKPLKLLGTSVTDHLLGGWGVSIEVLSHMFSVSN